MKIELKAIKFSESLSEETNAFTANLYINGKKVGYCKNDGHGGCTDYYADSSKTRDIIVQAEQYCKTLPPVKYGEHSFNQSLESVIDNILEDWLIAKEKAKADKQIIKLMPSAIIVGVPNSGSYSYWKQKVPLNRFPVKSLQMFVDQIKSKHCTDGKVILNTNLKELGVNI